MLGFGRAAAIKLCPYPRHALNAPDAKVGQLIKGRGGEVEVGEGARGTAVSKSNSDTLSLICGTGKLLIGVD
jgi:hypothetical protein